MIEVQNSNQLESAVDLMTMSMIAEEVHRLDEETAEIRRKVEKLTLPLSHPAHLGSTQSHNSVTTDILIDNFN
jgi:hypothetical protein